MTSKSIPRIAEAAAVIRDLVGFDFEWDTPGDRQYGRGAMMLLLHEPGSPMRAWCNYDCREYDKIDRLADALGTIGLMVEDCTGDYSGVYEESI
jgi:hypothetical protein